MLYHLYFRSYVTFLNFGNGGHFRLKWRFLLISLSTNFQKGFYCIIWPWKPWYRAHPYNCSINILGVMAQFTNFGNGGYFRLKKVFFIENVRVHVNSYWTIISDFKCLRMCLLHVIVSFFLCWPITWLYMPIYYIDIVASELNDLIWHSSEWQIGSFSSEATIYYVESRENRWWCV